jgi:glycerol kinase
MEADSGVEARELRVDGGATANDWLMTFQAGVLGIPVRRPPLLETTALGAAGLAGLAAGVWGSGDDFLAAQGEPSFFSPDMDESERAPLLEGWRRAVRATLSWAADAT